MNLDRDDFIALICLRPPGARTLCGLMNVESWPFCCTVHLTSGTCFAVSFHLLAPSTVPGFFTAHIHQRGHLLELVELQRLET